MIAPSNALLWGEADELRSVSSAAGLGAVMAELYSAGFILIPLGGDDGKKPLLRGWHESKRLPLAIVQERMRRAGSLTYGIRLDGLMVVDLDTDNDATRAYCDRRFDPSPLVVTTGRGEHRYYRYKGPSVSAVREPGIAIDFKAGPSAFVVGPGSCRPDGKSYRVAYAGSRDDGARNLSRAAKNIPGIFRHHPSR